MCYQIPQLPLVTDNYINREQKQSLGTPVESVTLQLCTFQRIDKIIG